MDYDHLRNELVGNYSNLSRRLQQITRHAMSNPNEMALETIVVIAERADVPQSSLIRFAKVLVLTVSGKCRKCFSRDW